MSLRSFRIARIYLENFKGFEGGTEIDLEADLVLVVGSNGRGKTSLVEAIERLALGGDLAPRGGGSSEALNNDSVHRGKEKAKLWADWSGGGQDTLEIQRSDEAPQSKGHCQAQLSRTRWATTAGRAQLRATTFLYSDSLAGILGVGPAGVGLDAYLPEGERLSRVCAGAASDLSALVTREHALQLADGKRRKALDKQVLTAMASVQDRAGRLGVGLQLLNAAQKELKKPRIEPLLDALEIEAKYEDPDFLERIATASRARAEKKQHKQTTAQRADGSVVVDVSALSGELGRLVHVLGNVPGPQRKATFRTLDAIATDIAQLERSKTVLEQERDEVLRVKEGPGLPKMTVGTLALLGSLADGIERPLPEWWADLGLQVSSRERSVVAFQHELRRWRDLQQRLESARSDLAGLAAERDEAKRWAAAVSQYEGLIASLTALNIEILEREDGNLDVEAIAKAMPSAPAGDRSEDDASRVQGWRSLADAIEDWRNVAVQRAALPADPSREAVPLKGIDAILTYMFEPPTGMSASNFSISLRRHEVEARFLKDVDIAARGVLAAYSHRDDFQQDVRFCMAQTGGFTVTVGRDVHATGLSSLSRSQLTSVAFSLAITANLALPAPPLGFICLDDVSDAFDLDNLASDAALLRMLAYGPTPRQLILTNHDEELTDRLLPLLLPPAGRTMKVVQLVSEPCGNKTDVRQWTVRGELGEWNGRSPLREFYR